MTLTLELSPDLQSRLTHEAAVLGVPVEKYALEVLEQRLPHATQNNTLAADLQAWIEASSGQPPSDELLHQIDTDRSSDRQLYPPELKGVTW